MMPSTRRPSLAPALAFAVFFPGYFLYQTGALVGFLPPLSHGYILETSLLLLPILICIFGFLAVKRRIAISGLDAAFFAFLVYFALIVGINALEGADGTVVSLHRASIIFWLVAFLIFRLCDFSEQRTHVIALACFWAITGLIAFYSAEGVFLLAQLQDGNDELVFDYQYFAKTYFCVALATLPFIRRRPVRIAMEAATMASLFVIGARTEVVAIIVLTLILEVGLSNRRAAAATIAVACTVVVWVFLDEIVDMLPASRILDLLRLSEDVSYIERTVALESAVRTIQQHPFTGDYASYVQIMGSRGYYAHNILSAWVDLGFIGFLALLSLLAIPLVGLVLRAGKSSREDLPPLIFALAAVSIGLFMQITAKTFIDLVNAVAIGAAAHCLDQMRRHRNIVDGSRNAASHLTHPGRPVLTEKKRSSN